MADEIQSEGSKALDQAEHNRDGNAKRVVLRYQDPVTGDWLNFTPPQTAGVEFDYIDIDKSTPGETVYTKKLGGSGGTTVQTITVTADYVEFA